MKNIVLILAGGSGTRLGESIPKQFMKVNNKEILLYSLETFTKCDLVDSIVVVCQQSEHDHVSMMIKNAGLSEKVIFLAEGGNSRFESVANGINAINGYCFVKSLENPNILIHDSARPLISNEIIVNNIKSCTDFGSAVTAIPASDSILIVDKDDVVSEADRKTVWLAQTPQTFPLQTLLEALKLPQFDVTDDCGMILKLGINPKVVLGHKNNFKITTREDLQHFESLVNI